MKTSLLIGAGLLVLGAGDSTVRLSPPLTISRDQCDFALEVLEQCLKEATA
jgi:4-aminobutyrate aminotransferase